MRDLQMEISEWLDAVDGTDLATLEVDRLRDYRNQGRRLENLISYSRRLVQTRLDIVDNRAPASPEAITAIVTPSQGHPDVAARFIDVDLSDDDAEVAGEYLRTLIGQDRSHSLDLLNSAQLSSYRLSLEEGERGISRLRHQIHERLDGLGTELVRRYKDGEIES